VRTFFAALLRLFPAGFRARFGPEVLEQSIEECEHAFSRGRVSGLACVLEVAADLLGSAAAERWRPSWTSAAPVDEQRERGVGAMTSRWIRDVRHALRTLARAPGFTLASAGTLALALGVAAGVFTVVDAVLLRPLPFGEPDRLVYVAASAPGSDLPEEFDVSPEFWLHYRDNATQLAQLGYVTDFTATVRSGERVERLRQSTTSVSLFEVLGVTPVLGRLPRPEDAGRVALISHDLWTTWFARDPSVVGSSIDALGGSLEVIGVMGPEFRYPDEEVVLWMPGRIDESTVVPGRFGWSGLVGRLAPGADPASLARELDLLAKQLPERFGGSANYARVIDQHVPVVRSLRDQVVGEASTALWVLMGAVTLVLMVASANVASLFSVRAEGRVRDLAVRRALGAGRGALVRSQLAESLVVGALASAAALALAWVTLSAFLQAVPAGLPRRAEVHVSSATLLFTFLGACFAALACGALPAIRSSRPDLERLRESGRGNTRGRHRGRDALVVAQTAFALTLLVGSGLLLRSFREIRSVDPGFDTEDILTFQFAPDQAHLIDGPSWALFHAQFLERLRALPGVEAVGIVENVPLDEGLALAPFATDAAPEAETVSGPRAGFTFAAGDYFTAMGIEVLEGRGFGPDDVLVPGNVVVSRSAADLLWPGENPVGRQLRNATITDWHTVIGVVEDVLQYDLRDATAPIVYYPLVGPTPESWFRSSPGYVVRSGRAETIASEIRELVREAAPEAPMYRVFTMRSLVERSFVGLSFTMLTLAVAAGLALILGAVGLYGVLSYVVAERTREIGVRMALGAEAARVRGMVVAQGARVVSVGIVLGLGLALVAARALGGLLFQVSAADPWVLSATALAMALVGAAASYVPARRASRVDPIVSMRGG
jgi:predicted permease